MHLFLQDLDVEAGVEIRPGGNVAIGEKVIALLVRFVMAFKEIAIFQKIHNGFHGSARFIVIFPHIHKKLSGRVTAPLSGTTINCQKIVL